MESIADVVIVGGGIVGMAAAYYLAKQGMRPLLLEKGRIAGEQSSRNWGFVRQQGRDPAEIPLMMASNKIWQGLERELGADLEWTQAGNLVVPDNDQKHADYERWLKIAKMHQLDSRLIERTEIERLAPDLRTSGRAALYTPSDGHAEPEKVAPAFAAAAERLGATIRTNCAVIDVETSAGAVSGVITERGTIQTKIVVFATGAWTSRMLSIFGIRLPLLWMRATVARTTPATRAISPIAMRVGVGFRQRRDRSFNIAPGHEADYDIMLDTLIQGRRFLRSFWQNRKSLSINLTSAFIDHLPGRLSKSALGAELIRFRTLNPPANVHLVAATLEKFRRVLPELHNIEVERKWAGYIDFTPDLIPIIDYAERPRGLIVAAGLSGHGFGMGPIIGRLVAELATNGKPSLDIRAFRMKRFSDGTVLESHAAI